MAEEWKRDVQLEIELDAKLENQPKNRLHRPHRVPLRFDYPGSTGSGFIRETIESGKLHTVCQEAACPNLHHCWSRGTATFLILGNRCTRNCRFCDIHAGKPEPVDPAEPVNVAMAVRNMGLQHAVVTSVTRDDLPDGGAGYFEQTIRSIRQQNPESTTVEVLVPDFRGDRHAIETVIQARPDILNHNVETVPSLYRSIRPGATFQRSLDLLAQCAQGGLRTKSGIMLGLGESIGEVEEVLRHLYDHGVRMITIGQYLAPSAKHAPVQEMIDESVFRRLGELATDLGFDHVESGSLVRSSYHAEEAVQ